MYFEGGVSSVYLWDLEEQQGRELAFAGVVLLKKSESDSSTYSCKPILETDGSPPYRCGTYRIMGLAPRIRMPRKRSISEI
jgi:capping protein beta